MIHAAAMGDDPASHESIRSATAASLDLAAENGVGVVAFPVLGSGVGGYPFEAAVRAMVEAIRAFDGDRPEVVAIYGFTLDHAPAIRRVLTT